MRPDDDSLSMIEDRLRRGLMPVALSESAKESLHTLVDELAGGEISSMLGPEPAATAVKRAAWAIGAAAAAAVAVLFATATRQAVPWAGETASVAIDEDDASWIERDEPAAMRLVDESTRLAWVEDEGWLADPDGGAHRAVRMGVVEENRLLDEETGIIVHISSPREEMLLTPVSTF